MISTEVYAVGRMTGAQLWAVVGDPWRLPEWTDADAVRAVDPEPVEVGTAIATVEGGAARTWRVTTEARWLREMSATTDAGELALGYRVVRDPLGCRLILAAGLEPGAGRGRRSLLRSLRARVVDAPMLRSHLDRWSGAALRAADPDG